MEKRAENPEFDPVLKTRLVLSNRYYRIYKIDIFAEAPQARN